MIKTQRGEGRHTCLDMEIPTCNISQKFVHKGARLRYTMTTEHMKTHHTQHTVSKFKSTCK